MMDRWKDVANAWPIILFFLMSKENKHACLSLIDAGIVLKFLNCNLYLSVFLIGMMVSVNCVMFVTKKK